MFFSEDVTICALYRRTADSSIIRMLLNPSKIACMRSLMINQCLITLGQPDRFTKEMMSIYGRGENEMIIYGPDLIGHALWVHRGRRHAERSILEKNIRFLSLSASSNGSSNGPKMDHLMDQKWVKNDGNRIGGKGMERPLCDPVDGKAPMCLPY
jgi:hypothetical protein